MIDPKGPANRGSNTAAAIASTAARTSKKLSISPTSSNVTYYSADEMMLRNTVHSHQEGGKLCLGSRQPSREELVREERKRISEMEKLIFNLSSKIGTRPKDFSSRITRETHANGKVMKKLKRLASMGGSA